MPVLKSLGLKWHFLIGKDIHEPVDMLLHSSEEVRTHT